MSKVKITTADETARRIFYTALYHTMIAPSLFCDVNGDYYGSDHAIHRNADFTNYTTFSLWDTYRAAMPLMTVLHPEKMADIVQTMLHIADEQGRLPVWHLWGNETDCMVGNPGIVAVADAIVTSGGVKIGEVDPKTMESKHVKGLFFAGELLDVDAYTGGFNLQIAWSTGYLAGVSIEC